MAERALGVAVLAVQAIARMRGGAQSQLMLGADGRLWVVKFQNNPQSPRVLANEWLATRLGAAMGLTVPATEVVEVTEWLIANTPELHVESRTGDRVRCRAGLQFGCAYLGGESTGQVLDYLPEEQLLAVANLREFAGVLLLDKWTANCNGRQAVFFRKGRERRYRAAWIDQGFCFNVEGWNFPDVPKRGVYGRDAVYRGVTGWESFEPWLTRLETMKADVLWHIAETLPPEWYDGDTGALERLMDELVERRGRVRGLIEAFRDCDRRPFPLWGRRAMVSVAESRMAVPA